MSLNEFVPVQYSVHTVPPPSEEPSITLTQWRIVKDKEGEFHFVGFDEKNWEGRVSSSIKSFSRSTLLGSTGSGRVYKLEGPSSKNPDAEYVWKCWCAYNGTDEVEDVSETFTTP